MATQSIPYTTGNDILSYKGDAGLAAGANNGISPRQGDPFAGLGTTIDQVNEHHAQMAILQYKQKIKDQEDLASLLASTGGSVFNMKGANGQNVSYSPLPEDQKILDTKAKGLRETILANPENYQYDPGYLDKLNEYKSLVSHAGIRAKAYTDFNLDAQKETDPQEQHDILGQRNSEINGHKLTDFHNPEPHLPSIPTGDPSDFVAKEALNQKNWQLKSDDGKTETYIVPSQYITDPRTLAPGNPLYAKALKLGQKYLTSPSAQNFTTINRSVNEYNQGRNLKPGDPGYMDLPYFINNDGKPEFIEKNPVKNALNIAAALTYEKYGRPITVAKSAEDMQKIKDEQAAIVEKNRQQNETERHNKATEGKESKATTESIKEQQDQLAGRNAYTEVHAVFNQKFENPAKAINPINLPATDLIKSEGYEIYQLPASSPAHKYIGIEAPHQTEKEVVKGEKGTTVTTSGDLDAKGSSLKPDAVYMAVNPTTKEKKLIYLKGGNVVASVNERDAALNTLKHDSKYDQKVYEKPGVWAQHIYDQGGATTPVRRVVGGNTYEQDDNGKWFKVE